MKIISLIMLFLFLSVGGSYACESYTVTWTITHNYLVPCPDVAVPDKFGREPFLRVSCCVMHWGSHDEQRSRVFRTLEEAEAFCKEGKESGGSGGMFTGMDSTLSNFKITPQPFIEEDLADVTLLETGTYTLEEQIDIDAILSYE